MLYPLSYEGSDVAWVDERSRRSLSRPQRSERAAERSRRLRNMRRCPPTVLVVEDDPVILRLLEVNFELEGFGVLSPTTAPRASRWPGPTSPT